jgi:hypothetical protein
MKIFGNIFTLKKIPISLSISVGLRVRSSSTYVRTGQHELVLDQKYNNKNKLGLLIYNLD